MTRDEDEVKRGLREWAEANGNVCQLWLFDRTGENSDVDIALALRPGDGRTDWALLRGEWNRQLKGIVGRDVSIAVIEPGEDADVRVRREGVLLWAR